MLASMGTLSAFSPYGLFTLTLVQYERSEAGDEKKTLQLRLV
jgi:hypothetical protein